MLEETPPESRILSPKLSARPLTSRLVMRLAFVTLSLTLLAMTLDRGKIRKGELLVQSSDAHTLIIVRQESRIVVPATQRRSLTLPSGHYEVEILDKRVDRPGVSERVSIVAGGQTVVRLKPVVPLTSP